MSKRKNVQIKENKLETNIFCFICFFAVTIILILPLINKAQIFGHDAWYHITRIEALKVQILDGHPFSRINYFFNQGEGYASSLCYPDLLLYIPALLRIIGLDINITYNIFLMLIGIACYGTTFYAAYKITSDKYSATICAAMFTLCQYHLDNILTRSSVGEIQAFIFIPLVIYGIYNYLYEDFSNPAVMGIGFIGLILSHTITTFLSGIIYAIIFLINIPKIIKAPKNLIKLGITAACVLLVTAYYWIPLMEIMTKMDLKVSHLTRHVSDTGIKLSNLFADIKMDTSNNLGLGLSIFILLIFRFFIKRSDFKKKEKQNASSKNETLLNIIKIADAFAITGVIVAFCSTNLFPWKLFDNTIVNSIQFAWRLFIVASVFMSFATALYTFIFVSKSKVNKTAIYSILAVIICILGFAHTQTANPSYKLRAPTYFTDQSDYKDGFDGTVRTGGSEWLPFITAKNKAKAFSQCDIVKDNSNKTYNYVKEGTTVTVNFPDAKAREIQVPLIYYIGYVAEFTDKNDEVTALDIKGNNSCGLAVTNIPAKQGTLKVYYKGTALQKISLVITLVSIAALIAYAIIKKRKKKEKSEND